MNQEPLDNEASSTDIELAKRESFMKAAGLSTLDHTFENFDQHQKGTEKAYRATLALGIGTTDKPFLLIYGGVGNGKTHLIEATIIALGKRGIFAQYWTSAAMADFLKEGIKSEHGHPNVADRIEQLCHSRVLVLDDLGVEYGTDWQWSNLEMIIDYRYRFKNITIVVTNMDIEELQVKSERILSRFSDQEVSQLVLNKGEDYRGLKKE